MRLKKIGVKNKYIEIYTNRRERGTINNNLVEKRDILLTEVKEFCLRNNTDTFFLGGSLAKRNADEFSDIDFRVVLQKDESKSKFLKTLLDEFQPKIAFIETLTSFFTVVHFSVFVKLDLFVYYPSDLAANVWLKDILILQDDINILQYLKEESFKINYVVTEQELKTYLNKYTSYLHELYRRSKRKEYNYCEHCTLMMKHILVSLWLIEMGDMPNDLGDWSKYEGSRSSLKLKQKEFIDTYTPINFENMNSFVYSMNREILKTGKNISRHMEFNLNIETYNSLFDLNFKNL